MTITLRSTKGSELTHAELDGNFTDLDSRIQQIDTFDSGNAQGLINATVANYATLSGLNNLTNSVATNTSNISQIHTSTLPNYITINALKNVVAASADFADFQVRIAAL